MAVAQTHRGSHKRAVVAATHQLPALAQRMHVHLGRELTPEMDCDSLGREPWQPRCFFREVMLERPSPELDWVEDSFGEYHQGGLAQTGTTSAVLTLVDHLPKHRPEQIWADTSKLFRLVSGGKYRHDALHEWIMFLENHSSAIDKRHCPARIEQELYTRW